MAEFDAAKHPRWPKGSPHGGEFITVANLLSRLAGTLDKTVAIPGSGVKLHQFGNKYEVYQNGKLVDSNPDAKLAAKSAIERAGHSAQPVLHDVGTVVHTPGGGLGVVNAHRSDGRIVVTPSRGPGKAGTILRHTDVTPVSAEHLAASAAKLKQARAKFSVGDEVERWPGDTAGLKVIGFDEVTGNVILTGQRLADPATLGKPGGVKGLRRKLRLSADADSDLHLAGAISAKSAASGAPGDAMGKIRNIVMSAHKWGGDGKVPIFRKIRARLVAEHPEVIAKAFGGDPDKAAGWIKARWYQLRGRKPPGNKAIHASICTSDDDVQLGYDDVGAEFAQRLEDMGVTHELFLSGEKAGLGEDGLVWKTVARTGTWKVSPIPGGDPLVLDKPFFDDLKQAFDEGAWEHVTVPLSHKDRVDENTGFVKALQVAPGEREGEYKLRAGIKFTEPDIQAKTLRGTIANTSIGASLKGVTRTSDGKFFPRVLKHVALTNQPWLTGLEPFGSEMAASLASWEMTEADDVQLGDLAAAGDLLHLAAWNTDDDFTVIRSRVEAALRDLQLGVKDGEIVPQPKSGGGGMEAAYVPGLCVIGIKPGKALLGCYSDDSYGWVASYGTDAEGNVDLQGKDDWSKVEKQWVELAHDEGVDLALGWLPADVKESELDDGDFAVVYSQGGKKVRKLPYKVHGKVNEAGWRAAWSMVAKTKLPDGINAFKVRKKLLAAKPAGVNASAGNMHAAASGGQVVKLIRKGGDTKMGDENKEGGEVEVIELTRDQLQAELQAAIEADRARNGDRMAVLEAELRNTKVDQLLASLEGQHSPKVLRYVEDVLRSDSATAEVTLNLSHEQEDGTTVTEDQTIPVGDIVLGLLEAIGPTAGTLELGRGKELAAKPDPDANTGTAKERADALMERLRKQAAGE
jgi:hypothetical protein